MIKTRGFAQVTFYEARSASVMHYLVFFVLLNDVSWPEYCFNSRLSYILCDSICCIIYALKNNNMMTYEAYSSCSLSHQTAWTEYQVIAR